MLSCNTAQFRSSHVCVHGFESDSEILCDNFLVKELDVEAKYFSLSICPRLATISPFFLAKDECFAPPTHQPRVSKEIHSIFKLLVLQLQSILATVVEKNRKSIIQYCERSELRFNCVEKLIENAKNGQFWRVFENIKLAVKKCYHRGHF